MNIKSYNRILGHTAAAWNVLEDHRTARKAELVQAIKAEIQGRPEQALEILINKIAGIKATLEIQPRLVAATVEGASRTEAHIAALNMLLAPARCLVEGTAGLAKATSNLFRRKADQQAAPAVEPVPA